MYQRPSDPPLTKNTFRDFRHSKRQADRGGPPRVGGWCCRYESTEEDQLGAVCDGVATVTSFKHSCPCRWAEFGGTRGVDREELLSMYHVQVD